MASWEEIFTEIFEDYDNNPENWRFLIGADTDGRSICYLTNGKYIYLVKEDTAFKDLEYKEYVMRKFFIDDITEDLRILLKSPITFGFREVSNSLLKHLISNYLHKPKETLKKISEMAPVPLSELKNCSKSIIGIGPMQSSKHWILSRKQLELERKMDAELRKLTTDMYIS